METFGIKIPNAVLVDGATDPSLRVLYITEFLGQCGEINRNVTITETESEFCGRIVIEFTSGFALAKLSPLRYTYTSETSNKFCIESLSEIYAFRLCGPKTQSYLSEHRCKIVWQTVCRSSSRHAGSNESVHR